MLDQYYPYKRVDGYGTLPAVENIPYMVRNYLMDMPSGGYTPPDDNRSWRCQLMKYLYYDGEDPLNNPLPTPAQKRSIVYDTDSPDKAPTDKGYRIFAQSMVSQAQTLGVSTMRIWMGKVIPKDAYSASVSVSIDFLTNADYEANTRSTALSRTYAMACLALRALSGVDMGAGVGTWMFDRRVSGECYIVPITDETTNVGYRLTMGMIVEGTDGNDQ